MSFIKNLQKETQGNGGYEYPPNAREISGFGGGYEDACRKMVKTGMIWLDEHPDADINFKQYENIYGITTGESDDCKTMQEVMLKEVPDCSGAMMQASLNHIMYAHKNGWDQYIIEMTKDKE